MNYNQFKKTSKLVLIVYMVILGIAWSIFTPLQDGTVVKYITIFNHYDNGDLPEFLKRLCIVLVAMVPIGILVPFSKGQKCKNKTYCIGITVIVLAEFSRFAYFGGIVCLDEIFAAFLGIIVGYAIYKLMCKIIRCGSRFLWIKEDRKKGWMIYLLLITGLMVLYNNYGLVRNYICEHSSKIRESDILGKERFTDYEEPSIYDITYDALKNYQTQIEYAGIELDCNEIHNEITRVLSEHPEIFWVTGGGKGTLSSNGIMQVYWYQPDVYGEMSEVPQMEAAMMACVDDLISKCPEGSEYEKALWIHDMLVTNVEYDENVFYSSINPYAENVPYDYAYTAYGAIINRRAVCAGYAKAYKLILNRMGIECGYITGIAENELVKGPHAWNYVRLDGAYYLVDVTWDDPIMAGNTDNMIRHDYFAITDQEMARDHIPDPGQDIPICVGKTQ